MRDSKGKVVEISGALVDDCIECAREEMKATNNPAYVARGVIKLLGITVIDPPFAGFSTCKRKWWKFWRSRG